VFELNVLCPTERRENLVAVAGFDSALAAARRDDPDSRLVGRSLEKGKCLNVDRRG
jgi:Tfp pilus assembly pilus retraction ATPase PilT